VKWFRKKQKPVEYTIYDWPKSDPKWSFLDPIFSDTVTGEQQKRIKEVVFSALKDSKDIPLGLDYLADRTNEQIVVILEGYPQREMIAEYEQKKREFSEILALPNPLVKKIMLQKYFDLYVEEEDETK